VPEGTSVSAEKTTGGPPAHVAALVVAVVFGVGFFLGRATSPDAGPPEPVVVRATPTTTPAATERATPTPTTAARPRPLPRPRDVDAPDTATEPRLSEAEVDDRIAKLLEAQRTAQTVDDHHVREAALLAQGALVEALAADPDALLRAIARFRGLTDPTDLEALAVALAQVADPAVEDAALEVARRDADPRRRAAALDILDHMDTPAARDVALDVLATEQDVELRRRALMAVPPPAGVSHEQAAAVLTTLNRILGGDRDEDLRQRAAVDLGSWGRSTAELRPLLDILARDPSPKVRAGAAFGLEAARDRSPEVVAALVRALQSQSEDPDVRENCWRALSAISPLPADAQAAWQTYKDQHEAQLEASPDGEQGDDPHGDH
jgi:hypothetical protein